MNIKGRWTALAMATVAAMVVVSYVSGSLSAQAPTIRPAAASEGWVTAWGTSPRTSRKFVYRNGVNFLRHWDT